LARELNNLWINKEMLRSEAFRTITAPTSFLVLHEFYARKQLTGKKSTGYTMTNNGEIIFPYATAEKKGISNSAFMRAVNDLLARGFIYIAHEGGAMQGDATRYGLSENWMKYGRADFQPAKRSRRRDRFPNAGFKKGHPYHPPYRTQLHGDL
jgi:hypothetical protein